MLLDINKSGKTVIAPQHQGFLRFSTADDGHLPLGLGVLHLKWELALDAPSLWLPVGVRMLPSCKKSRQMRSSMMATLLEDYITSQGTA